MKENILIVTIGTLKTVTYTIGLQTQICMTLMQRHLAGEIVNFSRGIHMLKLSFPHGKINNEIAKIMLMTSF